MLLVCDVVFCLEFDIVIEVISTLKYDTNSVLTYLGDKVDIPVNWFLISLRINRLIIWFLSSSRHLAIPTINASSMYKLRNKGALPSIEIY